jgi:hypothetical protein
MSESNFNVEFEIEHVDGVTQINFMDKVGQTFPYTFQFGKERALFLDGKMWILPI